MDVTSREQRRLSLLRYLDAQADANPGRALATAVLHQHLRAEGLEGETRDTMADLLYLQGGELVARQDKTISPEVARWIITKAGRDHYATSL
jgi:hypothetical protein